MASYDPSAQTARKSPQDSAPLPVDHSLIPLDTDEDPVWPATANEDLRKSMSEHVTVLFGRNSGKLGRDPAESAVENLGVAVSELRQHGGPDLAKVIPPNNYLLEKLRSTPHKDVSVSPEGTTFSNAYRLVYLRRQRILLVLSNGSAHMVNRDRVQPFTNFVFRLLRDFLPLIAVLFFAQWDRLTRQTWATGAVIGEARERAAQLGRMWVGDGEQGWMPLGPDADLTMFMRSMTAQQGVSRIKRNRIERIEELSEKEMVNGRAVFPVGGTCPPGAFVWASRDLRRQVLNIDELSLYPSPSEASRGIPDVRLEDGTPVASAPTLVEMIEAAARGATYAELCDLAVERHWSTHVMRARRPHTPQSWWGGPTRPREGRSFRSHLMRCVFSNLDNLETTTLKVVLKRETKQRPEQSFTITGFKPLVGEWGSKAGFDALRDMKDQRRSRYDLRRTEGVWNTVAIELDGFPARLSRYRPNSPLDEEPSQIVRMSDEHKEARSRLLEARGCSTQTLVLPQSFLTQMLLEAHRNSQFEGLRPYVESLSGSTALESLRVQEAALNEQLELLSRQMTAQWDRLSASSADGTPWLEGAALRRASEEYNEVDLEVSRTREGLSRVRDRAQALASRTTGVDTEALVRLADQLEAKTPVDAELLRNWVRDMRIQTSPFTLCEKKGVRVEVTASLVTASEHGPLAARASGHVECGPAALEKARALETIGLMRQGVVTAARRSVIARQAYVRELLGIAGRTSPLTACRDPWLLVMGMAATAPEPIDGEAADWVRSPRQLLADPGFLERHGGPRAASALMRRVHAVYVDSPKANWLIQAPARNEVTAILALAGLDVGEDPAGLTAAQRTARMRDGLRTARSERLPQWDFDRPQPRLRPCAHCGGSLMTPMRFREAAGYVCLSPGCRLDANGVRWDAEVYDRWVMGAETWIAAGVDLRVNALHGPTGGTESGADRVGLESLENLAAPRRRVARNTLNNLSSEDRAQIVKDLRVSGRPTNAVLADFRISEKTLGAVLDEAGVERPKQTPSTQLP